VKRSIRILLHKIKAQNTVKHCINSLTLFYMGFFFTLFYAGAYFLLCNFLRRACRTKVFGWRCLSDSKFFSIIIWGDDVIHPVDDVTFLVKNNFLLLLRCLLLFQSIVYVFMFKGYHMTSFGDVIHG